MRGIPCAAGCGPDRQGKRRMNPKRNPKQDGEEEEGDEEEDYDEEDSPNTFLGSSGGG